MFSMKKIALALALVGAAASASAMTAVSDEELSNTVGQDGVSIAADLHINIGSFKYTDTDAAGGSVSFKDIKFTGALAMSIDIINEATAVGHFIGLGLAVPPAGVNQAAGDTGSLAANKAFYPGGDVVQIAFPNLALANTNSLLSTSVASISMGGTQTRINQTTGAVETFTPSFGSFEMNKIDLRGTQVWMWAH